MSKKKRDWQRTVSKMTGLQEQWLPAYAARLKRVEDRVAAGGEMSVATLTNLVDSGERAVKEIENATRTVDHAATVVENDTTYDPAEFGFVGLIPLIWTAGVLGVALAAAYIAGRGADVAEQYLDLSERELDLVEAGKLSRINWTLLGVGTLATITLLSGFRFADRRRFAT